MVNENSKKIFSQQEQNFPLGTVQRRTARRENKYLEKDIDAFWKLNTPQKFYFIFILRRQSLYCFELMAWFSFDGN
jgi:hypothetical protein